MPGLLEFSEPTKRGKRLPLYDLPDELTDRFGPVTEASRAGLLPNELRAGDLPTRGERIGRAVADYGSIPAKMAVEIAKQPIRSQAAIEEAMHDPSIANLTNAGLQASAAISPRAALGILGGGYTAAAVKDMGLIPSLTTSAHAGKKKAEDAPPPMAAMPGLTPEQNKELGEAKARAKAGDFSSGADRRAVEGAIKRLEDLSADFVSKNNTAKVEEAARKAKADQEEHERATMRAEDAKKKELARDWKFDDTEFGKTFQKTGGAAAAAAAFGGGLLNRLGHQALTGSAKQGLAAGLLMPAIEGTGLAFTANNLPLANDAFLTSPTNPKKDALMAYARELPPEDPRRIQAEKDAAKLPDRNPVREQAGHEFWDQFASRLGTSAVEGIPSALTGNMFAPALKGAVGMAARAPGRTMENYYGAMTGAEEARAKMLAARNVAEGARNDVLATRSAAPPPRQAPIPLREERGLLPAAPEQRAIAPPIPTAHGNVSGDAAIMKMIDDMRRGGASEAQVEAFIKSISRSGGILP